jgi:class 3 adenylate cyclase
MQGKGKAKTPSPRKKAAPISIGHVLYVDIVAHSARSTVEQTKNVENLFRLAKSCKAYAAEDGSWHFLAIPTGDGFALVFLRDALAPARLALELQEKLSKVRDFAVRLGIHSGPIQLLEADISGKPNVIGEAINVASRICDCAQPNQILLSALSASIIREGNDPGMHLRAEQKVTVQHGLELDLFRLEPQRTAAESRLAGLARRLIDRRKRSGLATAEPSEVTERLGLRAREFATGLLLSALVLVLHHVIESLPPGRYLQFQAYNLLVGQMPGSREAPPVLTVDIGTAFDKPQSEETDLVELRKLVQSIVELRPAAIAIDIDFGFIESEQRFLDNEGDFVPFAARWTQDGTPVYVAVDRGIELGPDEWLGKPEYSMIAAHPFRISRDLHGQKLALASLETSPGVVVPSLADRLADEVLKRGGFPRTPPKIARSYSEAHQTKQGQVGSRAYYLNFSLLDRLKMEAISVTPGQDLTAHADRIQGSAILIGSSNVRGDVWIRPDTGDVERGLYLHSLAAATRITAPIYELKEGPRLMLAVIMTLSILAVVLAVGIAYSSQPQDISRSRVALLSSVCMAILVLGIGLWTIRIYGVLWTDFLLLSVFLAYHPRIEHVLVHVNGKLWSALGSLGRSFVTGSTR